MSTAGLLPVLHPWTVLLNSSTASVSWVVPTWHLAARHRDHSWGLLVASEILLNSLKGFGGTALVKGLLFLPQKEFSCPEGLADSCLTTTESKQRHPNCSISSVEDTQSLTVLSHLLAQPGAATATHRLVGLNHRDEPGVSGSVQRGPEWC